MIVKSKSLTKLKSLLIYNISLVILVLLNSIPPNINIKEIEAGLIKLTEVSYNVLLQVYLWYFYAAISTLLRMK